MSSVKWLLGVNILLVSCLFSSFSIKPKLIDCGFKEYSQYGEDGIIDKIFSIITPKSMVCVEFGAWDGFLGSNTARLWSKCGWRGVLIESNTERFKSMLVKTKPYASRLILINQFVGYGKDDCIDAILLSHGVNEVDLMSIDVDGNDYYIAQSIARVMPRVIICEYNPTIPAHLDVYQKEGELLGCSIAALNRIFLQKGYRLVAITECNCFFVLAEDSQKIESIFNTALSDMRIDDTLCYIATTYDGKPFLLKKRFGAPWGIKRVGYCNKLYCGDQVNSYVIHGIQIDGI